jgi:hypothetical protein
VGTWLRDEFKRHFKVGLSWHCHYMAMCCFGLYKCGADACCALPCVLLRDWMGRTWRWPLVL